MKVFILELMDRLQKQKESIKLNETPNAFLEGYYRDENNRLRGKVEGINIAIENLRQELQKCE